MGFGTKLNPIIKFMVFIHYHIVSSISDGESKLKSKWYDKWEWNNATKITLISVIIGIIFGIVPTLLMKYLKGTL